MLFLFKKREESTCKSKLAGDIRNDLVRTFEKKGINVSEINIDIKANSLNVQVYVGQQLGQALKG